MEASHARTGATVWLTGLPAAGKTSIAEAVEHRLREEDRAVLWLDGDELRRGLARPGLQRRGSRGERPPRR